MPYQVTLYGDEVTIPTPHGTISIRPTYHYNPAMFGYITHASTRSVYFKTLLDKEEFYHIEGPVFEGAYDKIKDFENKNRSGMTSETIFKIDSYYVFGNYNKLKNKYYLRKFED